MFVKSKEYRFHNIDVAHSFSHIICIDYGRITTVPVVRLPNVFPIIHNPGKGIFSSLAEKVVDKYYSRVDLQVENSNFPSFLDSPEYSYLFKGSQPQNNNYRNLEKRNACKHQKIMMRKHRRDKGRY